MQIEKSKKTVYSTFATLSCSLVPPPQQSTLIFDGVALYGLFVIFAVIALCSIGLFLWKWVLILSYLFTGKGKLKLIRKTVTVIFVML